VGNAEVVQCAQLTMLSVTDTFIETRLAGARALPVSQAFNLPAIDLYTITYAQIINFFIVKLLPAAVFKFHGNAINIAVMPILSLHMVARYRTANGTYASPSASLAGDMNVSGS